MMKNGIAGARSGSEAAKKAWATIRRKRRERALEGCQPLDVFLDYTPESVHMGEYRMASHLIKPSKLTSKDNGGIGKDLSEGWAANFAIGCTHGCPFCYVDSIHRRYRGKSLGFEDIRVRPGYFPYTEPSIEVEVLLGDRWLEMGGSGVFRPEVTAPFGVEDPVLAWGQGLERIAMILYGIDDIRQLYETDLDWLRNRPLK